MRIATWNVNSLRARMPRVLEFLGTVAPDVVLLQETKTTPEAYPGDELLAAGYESVHHSGGRWAGVAVLARAGLGLEHAATGLPGEVRPEEARWVEAHIPGLGVRVASAYVVNGREVGSTTFDEKLRFLEAMGARAADIAGEPLIVGGDFNVAPEDVDVYDPAAFVGATHVTEDERGRLRDVLERGGLVDAYRALDPDGVHHTWWDYRGGSFHRGLGLRIDLLLVSRDLAPRLRACGIARELRKGEKPSDHAPLVADLDNG